MSSVTLNVNERQHRFVLAYLKDPNGTRAAIKAGYSPISARDTANELLKNPNVLELLEKGRLAREERTQVSIAFVIDKLLDVIEKCLQDVPVLDHEGEPTGEYKFDSSGANKALDMLAKHVGLYAKNNNQKALGREELEELIRHRGIDIARLRGGANAVPLPGKN